MRFGRHSPTYTELLTLQTDGSRLTIGSKLVALPLSEFQMIAHGIDAMETKAALWAI